MSRNAVPVRMLMVEISMGEAGCVEAARPMTTDLEAKVEAAFPRMVAEEVLVLVVVEGEL